MDEIYTITGIVKHLLEEDPETRNSDEKLYYEVCRMLNPHALTATFGYVINNRKEYGLPSIESVSRARRKIVECNSELSGVDSVQGGRWAREKVFHEYAAESV